MGQHTTYKKYLAEIGRHIEHTNDDKYAYPVVDHLPLRMHAEYGKGFNMGEVVQYINRYMSSGYVKSDNRNDLLKAIHLLIFELERTDKDK